MFYLHEFGNIAASFCSPYDQHFYDKWCREACTALSRHPERTDDAQASTFSVAASTLRCVSFASVPLVGLATNLATLVKRNPRKRYLVFDMSDPPTPLFGGKAAIVCKSAAHEAQYSPSTCIAIPQFPRFEWDFDRPPASQRRFLAGFKGDPRPEYHDLRTRLLALDNDDDFIVKAAVLTPAHVRILESGRATEEAPPGELSYVDLMFSSVFALLPRSNGYALSYRMIESLNAGCIPVIISDGYVLPFSEILDYSDWSIRVAESDIRHLPDILRERRCDADRMQARAWEVYCEYFASTERIMAHTVAIASRLVSELPPLS